MATAGSAATTGWYACTSRSGHPCLAASLAAQSRACSASVEPSTPTTTRLLSSVFDIASSFQPDGLRVRGAERAPTGEVVDQVAAADDADQPAEVVHDGQSLDAVMVHHLRCHV